MKFNVVGTCVGLCESDKLNLFAKVPSQSCLHTIDISIICKQGCYYIFFQIKYFYYFFERLVDILRSKSTTNVVINFVNFFVFHDYNLGEMLDSKLI